MQSLGRVCYLVYRRFGNGEQQMCIRDSEYCDGQQMNLALSGGTACYLEISKMYEEDVSFVARVERIPEQMCIRDRYCSVSRE